MATKKKGSFDTLCASGKKKFAYVMGEHAKGKLLSSSGSKPDRKQAIAIAFSEARKHCASQK